MPSIPLRVDTSDSGCIGCLRQESWVQGSLYSFLGFLKFEVCECVLQNVRNNNNDT